MAVLAESDKEIVEITDDNRQNVIALFEKEVDENGYIIEPGTGERLECPYTETKVHSENFAVVSDPATGDPVFIKPTPYAFVLHRAREFEHKGGDE